jgi:hypothetical protein
MRDPEVPDLDDVHPEQGKFHRPIRRGEALQAQVENSAT